jgi:hypothetical protein
MGTVTIVFSNNVTASQIPSPTASTTPSTFTVNSNGPAPGRALSQADQLTVQIGVENNRGDPDRCTIDVSDSYGNASFSARVTVEWAENDTSIQYLQFSNFPLQQSQVTPMDKCDYALSLVNVTNPNTGTQINASVWTLSQSDAPA